MFRHIEILSALFCLLLLYHNVNTKLCPAGQRKIYGQDKCEDCPKEQYSTNKGEEIMCLHCSKCKEGVFGDEVKSVSGMEGESVTLHTDVVKQRDDKIVWYYGSENTFVARRNGKASSTMYSDDERFRHRVKMNDQTGDLTITHITSQHSGLYSLKISKNKKPSYKTFNLTVSGNSLLSSISDISNTISKQTEDLDTDVCHTCSDSPPVWVIIVPVVSALLICVIIIFVYKRRRMFYKASVSETVYAPVSDKGSSMSSSSSGDSNPSRFPNEQEKKHMLY